ncbi:hypothetical protein ACP70R_015572 [Stipagrostis hirtigluma subsp. patula]
MAATDSFVKIHRWRFEANQVRPTHVRFLRWLRCGGCCGCSDGSSTKRQRRLPWIQQQARRRHMPAVLAALGGCIAVETGVPRRRIIGKRSRPMGAPGNKLSRRQATSTCSLQASTAPTTSDAARDESRIDAIACAARP